MFAKLYIQLKELKDFNTFLVHIDGNSNNLSEFYEMFKSVKSNTLFKKYNFEIEEVYFLNPDELILIPIN